jgi:hypothetical protein
VLEGRYAICRLAPTAPVPAWLPARGFVSCTRTSSELSIVCEESAVPDGVRAERGWRALVVGAQLALDEIGVLAGLTAPLAAAGVSVFAVSTFDTDYLLVREGALAAAAGALRAAGYRVTGGGGTS